MQSVTLRAHFNGTQVVLDESYPLSPDTKLLITVLPNGIDPDSEEWLRFAEESFSEAFGDDEPEYTVDDLKWVNPEYEAR